MNHIVDTIIEFLTYSLIGISNVLIDIFIFNLLWTVSGRTQGNINYLFKLISFSVYSTTAFFYDNTIVFKLNLNVLPQKLTFPNYLWNKFNKLFIMLEITQ